MKHLKKFENFSKLKPEYKSINEETDWESYFKNYFKSKEEIADKFMELLKIDKVEALKAFLPFFQEFVEPVGRGYDSEPEEFRYNQETGEKYRLGTNSANFAPVFSKIYKCLSGSRSFCEKFGIDYTQLGLVSKIKRDEVLNILNATHRDFSVAKVAKSLFSPILIFGGDIADEIFGSGTENPKEMTMESRRIKM